jgi:hypothetical protein
MAMAWPSLFCMNREAFGLRIVKVNIEKVEKISKKACKLKKVMVCLYSLLTMLSNSIMAPWSSG